MVRRACCIPAIVLAFVSSVLLILSTVSLPLSWGATTPFSVVNAYNFQPALNDLTNGSNPQRQIQAASFGVWGYCTRGVNEGGDRFCNRGQGHAYQVLFRPTGNTTEAAFTETAIQPSWTRGLVIVVVAFVFSIVALALSFVPHLTVLLVAFVVQLLTFLLALIAFIVNIVMFVYTRNRIQQVSPNATVMPGVAFYLLLISLPFQIGAALTVCCGRRGKAGKYDYTPRTASAAYDDEDGTSTKKSGLLGKFGRRGGNTSAATGGSYGNDVPMDSRAKVLSAFNESKY